MAGPSGTKLQPPTSKKRRTPLTSTPLLLPKARPRGQDGRRPGRAGGKGRMEGAEKAWLDSPGGRRPGQSRIQSADSSDDRQRARILGRLALARCEDPPRRVACPHRAAETTAPPRGGRGHTNPGAP